MVTSECPECLAGLDIPEDVMIGEIFGCPDCGLELEVESISKEKIGFQKLAIEKEDWGE